ncbi:MAG: recombination protein RecR [Candidatus Yanofskybacteria bacterium]|nr:recombination protein RecR [Candidatus Yanofskybacteria bacterium]
MDPSFERIAKLLQTLPGVGPRASVRLVLALLDRPQAQLDELGSAISQLKERVRQCTECFNVSEDELCGICRDRRRDARSLLVVEKITDLQSVERAGLWRGLYHVLGGAISPVDGVGPEHLRIRELTERVDRFVQQAGAVEIVLATNPTSSGEMTALYIRDLFARVPGIKVTRLARGLATGTHLEYADEITLKHALDSRK